VLVLHADRLLSSQERLSLHPVPGGKDS
jgi:hypothetical protein